VRFVGCAFTYNALDGIDIASGCKGAQLVACDVSQNAYCGVNCYEGVNANGLYSSGGNGTGTYYANAGGGHFLRGLDFTLDQAYASAIVSLGASGLHVSDSHVTLTTTLQAVVSTSTSKSDGSFSRLRVTINSACEAIQLGTSGDLFSFQEITVDGSAVGSSYFFDTASGTVCRLAERLAIDACSYPYIYNTGSQWSRSVDDAQLASTLYTVPGIGGTWSIPFSDTNKSDRCKLTLVAPNGGTPQVIPPVVKTVGTGFAVTFAAADAGAKYAFEVL
jgi:hypothetical protein